MPNWKKLAVSGSAASFASLHIDTSITASIISGSEFTGSLYGTASQAISSSYALTASSANTFTVRNSLTASGLIYPTTDGTYESQVLQTNATGNLSFGDVSTTFDDIYNGEATTLIKGTPVYISGSNGANPKVYAADAANVSKMPVTYIVSENIASGNIGRGITLGEISGIDLTGYTAGTSVYVAAGGGWTSTRPTGSNVTIQFLGLVTKGGSGGKGLVLNPGPIVLPNIQTGYTWIGNGNNYPLAVSTSSLLTATASYAVSSSYAATSSYFNGLVDSASYAATASFAYSFPDQGFQFTQAVGSSTWTINHNLSTSTPLVDVYDSSYNQLIPASVSSISDNTTQITFSITQAGYAIISKGSGISSQIAVSASFATTASYAASVGVNFEQVIPSSTWTIVHNLNNKHPLVQIYDSSDATIIPQAIVGTSTSTVTITFSTAISGYARVI